MYMYIPTADVMPQFLYPNAKDSRALLSFLMELLPRNENADSTSTSEISASILPLISAELRRARTMLWTCPSTRPRSLRHASASSYRPIFPVVSVATTVLNPLDTKSLVTEQVRDLHSLPPSLFERNAIALAAQQRRDAEWESGAGAEAAAEAKKIALAKLAAAAFKGKVKGNGGSGGGSGQSAVDIVNEFASGNKVAETPYPFRQLFQLLSLIVCPRFPQASDGAFARAAKIAHDGDSSSMTPGVKPMSKVSHLHCRLQRSAADPRTQEDRDAAAAAEREEKKKLELQRQQEEQQAQEHELQQLQVLHAALCK
jgi:hypothetical protein